LPPKYLMNPHFLKFLTNLQSPKLLMNLMSLKNP
jgi:hypothetical protein